jgi:hypothetical protein
LPHHGREEARHALCCLVQGSVIARGFFRTVKPCSKFDSPHLVVKLVKSIKKKVQGLGEHLGDPAAPLPTNRRYVGRRGRGEV